MKITSVEIIPITQKHKGKLIFSTGPTPAADDFIILRIKTEEGFEGVGSAYAFQPSPILGAGASRKGAMALMADLAKIIIGEDPLRLNYILEKLERCTSGQWAENWHILAHFDHALYDLKGKILGLPVYELLGGVVREEIPLEYILSFLPTPEDCAEEARRIVDAGYRAIKLHVNADPVNAKARVKAVREAVGPDFPIAIDMGMAYKPIDAANLLRELKDAYQINFAEQPLWPYDIQGQQLLRRKTDVPMAADHSAMSLTQAYECMRQNLFDNYHCLITRVGGIRRAVKFCDMLETAKLDYQICNMDNSIAGAAAAHFAVTRGDRGGRYYDELGLYLYLHGTYGTEDIQDDIVKEQAMVIKNGTLFVPKGPGLGIELDEKMMKRYASPGINPILIK